MADWRDELLRWLAPFVGRFGHKARRRMCPLYVAGLIGPGDRKSVGPMAERVAPGDYDRLHHFVSDGVWDEAPLQRELAVQADKLVGGADALLVIDDTALLKKGTHSVGVAPQYASALGKKHVAEKYLQLARDAHTANNPVAAENYLQHAEHYFRLIATAQAAQLQAQKGDVRATGESGPEDLDEDDDLGGLPDRFVSPVQQAPAFTNPITVVAPAAPQPYGQRQRLVRRKA